MIISNIEVSFTFNGAYKKLPLITLVFKVVIFRPLLDICFFSRFLEEASEASI